MGNDWEPPKEEVGRPTRQPEGCLVAPLGAPLRLYYPPRVKPSEQGLLSRNTAATGRKPNRGENPSPAGRFRRGDHLPEGEIVAITITIVTGIIEIIINIIPNISTISIYIQSCITIATLVVIRTIHPLYSIGVDYYFVVNAIEFCWRNIFVSRLFITYLSPLIMISFMSCE